jgi:hypothetical protein
MAGDVAVEGESPEQAPERRRAATSDDSVLPFDMTPAVVVEVNVGGIMVRAWEHHKRTASGLCRPS